MWGLGRIVGKGMNCRREDHVSVAAARAVNLRKSYGQGDTEVVALDGVNVEFRQGEFLSLIHI